MTTKTSKTSARRSVRSGRKARKTEGPSPRSQIRARFEKSGPDAAIKFGMKLPGMSEATVKRYVAYFQSPAGKAEAKKAAKRAAKKAA